MTRQTKVSQIRRPAWAELGVSALNGFVGDYLKERQNGLEIKMAFYDQNAPVVMDGATLRQVHPFPSTKLCIFVNGLGCHEGIWSFGEAAAGEEGMSYGSLLHSELGYTPFYIRYNTGLHVYENGKELATLLDALVAAYPAPLDEIILIGHSMGGLVIRSACYYGEQYQYAWVGKVTRVFYLGTPHAGAPLERLFSLASLALRVADNPITKIIRDVMDLRSRGIKDLARGTLLDYTAMDDDPDRDWHNDQGAVPWLEHAAHYMIVGTLTADPKHAASRVLGDALVRLPSAQGPAAWDTDASDSRPYAMRVFPGVTHNGLAHHPEVYQQIKVWCQGEIYD